VLSSGKDFKLIFNAGEEFISIIDIFLGIINFLIEK
jgi:hypothetical protein